MKADRFGLLSRLSHKHPRQIWASEAVFTMNSQREECLEVLLAGLEKQSGIVEGRVDIPAKGLGCV
jgi:hypothetical protein